jgi:hypothetical protein
MNDPKNFRKIHRISQNMQVHRKEYLCDLDNFYVSKRNTKKLVSQRNIKSKLKKKGYNDADLDPVSIHDMLAKFSSCRVV